MLLWQLSDKYSSLNNRNGDDLHMTYTLRVQQIGLSGAHWHQNVKNSV